MKTIRTQTLFASFVIAMLLLLNVSPALAGGLRETAEKQDKFRGHVEVIFTKWITDLPNMAGIVSGDVGGGLFAGEILNAENTATTVSRGPLPHQRRGL